jgi:putative peptide zinc metalloprotease protein
MNERPTFSPFWHRVRLMKPRLRPHVQITRQRYRGRRWHIVHDPASNQFYRLNPIAHDLIGTLDGTREVEAAWKLSLSKFGDAAPTQNEIIQLLSQLYSANLLSVDTTPETEQLLRRGRERLKKRIAQQAIGIMYFKIRLFNPDRVLTTLEPIFRPVLNRVGLLVWTVLVLAALSRVLPFWTELRGGFDKAMSPSNWGWLIVVFVVTKAWHELGHGLICKRFGGQVPELGLMMLVLFPAPYVDASACWAFPSKWRRMAVGAGGMLFELFLASLCAFYWVWARSHAHAGELATQLAYNAMLTASISTVLFNANPLMRFDGYYMLADLLEVPNLAQRANKMLQYLMQKYVYRLERLTPPSTLRGEQATLVVYGVMSLAYRIFLFISITLLVMGKLFIVGAFLSVWTASAWFILPVGSFIHWLAAGPALAEHRARTIAISAALIAAAFVAVGVVPMPDHRRGVGVLECPPEFAKGVYYLTDGFVQTAHARPGETVHKDDPIVTLASPELLSRRESLLGQMQEVAVEERNARSKDQPAVSKIAAERRDVLRSSLEDIDRKIGNLVVRAPIDGVVVGADPESKVGAYVKKGDPVCQVMDVHRIRVAATLDQRQGSWINDLAPEQYRVEMRSVSLVERVVEGAAVEVVPAGQKVLPSAALGFAGGGQVETEKDDRSGRLAKRQRFTVYIDPVLPRRLDGTDEDGTWLGPPGERVKVRFTLPNKPLLDQWLDRLQKSMQGRIKI